MRQKNLQHDKSTGQVAGSARLIRRAETQPPHPKLAPDCPSHSPTAAIVVWRRRTATPTEALPFNGPQLNGGSTTLRLDGRRQSAVGRRRRQQQPAEAAAAGGGTHCHRTRQGRIVSTVRGAGVAFIVIEINVEIVKMKKKTRSYKWKKLGQLRRIVTQ